MKKFEKIQIGKNIYNKVKQDETTLLIEEMFKAVKEIGVDSKIRIEKHREYLGLIYIIYVSNDKDFKCIPLLIEE